MRLLAGTDAQSLDAAAEIAAAGRWDEIAAIAVRWKILASLEARTAALKIELPPAVRKEIVGHTSKAFIQSMLCIRSGTAALTALKQAGIPCLGFKGLATIGQLYGGGPRSRMLQDVDVLVRPQDAARSVEILEVAGLKRSMPGSWEEYLAFVRASPGSAGNEAVSLSDAQGGAVDLHWRLGGIEPDVLLANAQRVHIYNTSVPVAGVGHSMLLCVHHALRNDFVPDDIARDVCDFARWRKLMDETGEWSKVAADASRWGLKESCLALDIIVNSLQGESGCRIPFAYEADEMRSARMLADLYFHQLDERALNTDLAYLVSLRPALQILSGASSGWRQYLASMRSSEQINGEASLPLRMRLWQLVRSAANLSPFRWRQVRALAKAKDKLARQVQE